jgi:carbonic anhydrase
MLSRRHFCCSGLIAGSLLTLDRAFAADQCAALTQERQAALNPDDALAKLKAGNERFVSRNMRNCDLLEQVRATSTVEIFTPTSRLALPTSQLHSQR